MQGLALLFVCALRASAYLEFRLRFAAIAASDIMFLCAKEPSYFLR
jgi:hypothetical protein